MQHTPTTPALIERLPADLVEQIKALEQLELVALISLAADLLQQQNQ